MSKKKIKSARQICLETARLLSKPGKWTTGNYVSGAIADESYCAIGGMAKVSGCSHGTIEGNHKRETAQDEEAHKAWQMLMNVINKSKIGNDQLLVHEWNDRQTDVKPIVKAFEEAAELMK